MQKIPKNPKQDSKAFLHLNHPELTQRRCTFHWHASQADKIWSSLGAAESNHLASTGASCSIRSHGAVFSFGPKTSRFGVRVNRTLELLCLVCDVEVRTLDSCEDKFSYSKYVSMSGFSPSKSLIGGCFWRQRFFWTMSFRMLPSSLETPWRTNILSKGFRQKRPQPPQSRKEDSEVNKVKQPSAGLWLIDWCVSKTVTKKTTLYSLWPLGF